MTVEARVVDAADVLTLGPSESWHVVGGTLLVFAVPVTADGPGRRVAVRQVSEGAVVAGAALDAAHLIAVGLPGTHVVPAEWQVAAGDEMRRAAEEALAASLAADEATDESTALSVRHDARMVDDALLGLAAVVPGRKPDFYDPGALPQEVAVVDFMARQIGLRPNPLRLRRALADVEVSGRDSLTALAAAAGAAVRTAELAPGWWRREGPPVLLTATEDASHGAAVWRHGAYHVWQPTTGLQPLRGEDSASQWSRRAVLLEPLLDPTRPARLQDLVRLGLRGSGRSMWLVALLTVAIALLAAVIPVVSGQLTNSVASQTGSTLAVVAVALVAFGIGDAMLRAVRLFALLRIRGRGVAVAATAVWDRLLRLPMRWHNERTVAGRMADATAVDTASMGLPDPVIVALLDSAAVVGAVVGVMTASMPLALALIGFLAVRAIVELAVVRRLARASRAVVDAGAESQAVTLGVIGGVTRLRVSGAASRAFALWAGAQAQTTAVEVRSRRLMVVQQSIGAMWPALGLAVLLGATAISNGSVGQLVTGQSALSSSTAAVAAAVVAIGAALKARALLERAEEVLHAEPESGTGQEVARLAGAIDIRDVVFRYTEDSPAVLDGVSLSIPAGAHVAIVGPSGCGKSTLLRLVLGLEQPDSGIISYDGRDLSALDRASVRRQIGTVMQSSALMPGTIRDNVDLGRGLTATQVWQALDEASVADDVRGMPMGLSTVVSEGGGSISGGQRQRVLLARALAGQPRILILDEATSALDNVSQAAIVANLDRLRATRLVVAHRLSTIERADLVVMLAEGKVVAQGPFDTLMAAPGPFRDLVARQQL